MNKKNHTHGFLLYTMLLLCIMAHSQHLEHYLQQGLKNNPQIHAYDLQYQVATEKVNETNILPDTEFGVGYFVSGPQTRTGEQTMKFSAKQMIPWFGSFTARENYAYSLADAEFIEVAIAKRKLVLKISQSYYRLYALRAEIKVVSQQISLINTYKKLALTAVGTGTASAVDVLKLNIRKNDLKQQKAILQKEDNSEKSKFNTLLSQELSHTITVVDTLILPAKEGIVDLENLKLHPELIKYDKLYESVHRSELQNRKETLPKLGFGLDYISVDKMPDMDFRDNGKDVVMPMVSLSIPLFNNPYKSVSKQNELEKQVLNEQKNNRTNQLMSFLQTAIDKRDIARISVGTQDKNLSQIKDAHEILTKSFETDTANFNDLLDLQELQLKIQLDKIESTADYYGQVAIINYLIN